MESPVASRRKLDIHQKRALLKTTKKISMMPSRKQILMLRVLTSPDP